MISCRSSYRRGPEIPLFLMRFEDKIDWPPESILDSKVTCKNRPQTPRPPYPQIS